MKLFRIASAVAGVSLLLSGPIVAQTAATGPTVSKTTVTKIAKTTKTNAPAVRIAKSLDCPKQADAKNAHGKARKSFMSSCKKA